MLQMKDLDAEIIAIVEERQRREDIYSLRTAQLESALHGTQHQLTVLSDQLAQRTILYEAQERRWRAMLSGQTTLSTEKNISLIDAQSRLSQLQEQYIRVDSERLEAVVMNRDLWGKLSALQSEHVEERRRLTVAEEELSSAVQFTQELQMQLDRLKGADFAELEQMMMREAEAIRERATNRENELMLQLESGRGVISSEASRREELVDDLQKQKQRVRELEGLLRQLRGQMHGEQSISSLGALSNIDRGDDDSIAVNSSYNSYLKRRFLDENNIGGFQEILRENDEFEDGRAKVPFDRPKSNVFHSEVGILPLVKNQSTQVEEDHVLNEQTLGQRDVAVTGLSESFLTGGATIN